MLAFHAISRTNIWVNPIIPNKSVVLKGLVSLSFHTNTGETYEAISLNIRCGSRLSRRRLAGFRHAGFLRNLKDKYVG